MTRLPLEACTGADPGCPHVDCPDGWHDTAATGPCSCTPDCALPADEAAETEARAMFLRPIVKDPATDMARSVKGRAR